MSAYKPTTDIIIGDGSTSSDNKCTITFENLRKKLDFSASGIDAKLFTAYMPSVDKQTSVELPTNSDTVYKTVKHVLDLADKGDAVHIEMENGDIADIECYGALGKHVKKAYYVEYSKYIAAGKSESIEDYMSAEAVAVLCRDRMFKG
jgi:hypothetical protein